MLMREYGRKTEFLSRISPGFSRLGAAVFLAGFLLGMALIFIGQEGLVQNTSFLTSDSLEWIGTLEINRKGLMLYCLRQRLLPAVLLVLAAAAGAGGAAVCLFLLWSGFCAGTLLSVLALRYGIRGIMLFAGGILPQALLLVPAFWLLCGWCVSPGRNRNGRRASMGKVFHLSGDGGMLLLIFCALLCGCMLEGYVNPSILSRLFFLLCP